MKVSDCETVDSTYESIEQILGITRSQLDRAFEAFDIEKFYRDRPRVYQPADANRVLRSEEVNGWVNKL